MFLVAEGLRKKECRNASGKTGKWSGTAPGVYCLRVDQQMSRFPESSLYRQTDAIRRVIVRLLNELYL
jgi:hypothetical protein